MNYTAVLELDRSSFGQSQLATSRRIQTFMVIKYDLMQYIIISMKSILLKNALTLQVNYWQVLAVLFGFGGKEGVTLFFRRKTRNVFLEFVCGCFCHFPHPLTHKSTCIQTS